MLMLALDAAATNTVISILIWFVIFPAFVTGLIAYAIVIAIGERSENEEQRRFRR